MAGLSDTLAYTASSGIIASARILSDRQADFLGLMLGKLGYHIVPSRRRVALENLKRVFGDAYTDSEYRRITREVLEGFCRTMIEIARFNEQTPSKASRIIEVAGTDETEAILSEGRGGIVLTPHFGNFELGVAWLRSKGFPVSCVVKTHTNSRFNQRLIELRKSTGIEIIEIPKETLKIGKHLRQNRLVAMAPDQHDPSESLIMDFLGIPAAVATGPARFAVKAGCPLLVSVMRRVSYDRHIVYFGNTLRPKKDISRDQAVRDMTIEYTRFFENMIREYPDQWLWTHRRWKVKKESNPSA